MQTRLFASKERKNMKSKAEKEIDYDVHILELQKYRYADQGDDVSADELEVESDPVTEDM